ncbi:MAG TPA: glutamyl-tRNA reductase [Casimicrobiaceae bacterium]|jgi:glutamyl-tRNA reductase|nr:glutamyl-tRNA reductase [Casimicrobiaceae bacterium]
MPLYALGLNHSTAPLKVRELVAFQMDTLGGALRDLLGQPKVKEAAILSTCNRTEVYFHGTETEPVVQWLETFHRVPRASLSQYIYTLPQERAVPHAFRVASGLDSMVLGEPQILGQMKQAVKTAEAAGSLGLVLNRLFQRTFAVAKDVRTHTDIGNASISMAAAAIKLAERIFPSIAEQRVLLIGAGEMIDLCATHFAARQPRSITVANRTLERGAALASRVQADAITLNELPERLARFDIIVTSTASSLPILGKGMLERVIKARRHAPVFIVDLAVPRDVEPEAAELDDVFLYSVDDLANIVKDNLQIRVEAVREAEAMIVVQAESFLRWLEGRAVVPTITALHGHHDALRAAELERAKRLLANGTPADQVLEQLARGLTHKFLHGPTQALNEAGEAERAELLAMLQRVYHLPDEP